jgi:putative hemolysin
MEAIAILLCLAFSAIFSAVEIAFFSVNEVKLRARAEERGRGARLGLHLRSNPQKLLATILIGNNLANLTAAALVTVVTIEWFGPTYVALATGVLTFVVLMFAEIVPKTLAAKHALGVVQFMAYAIYGLEKVLLPLLFILEPLILKLTGGRGLSVPFATEEEVKIMLEAGGKAGTIETEEVKMIKNVFKLNDITAEDAMTPRIYVFALDGLLKLGDAKDQIFQSRYSRIPVFETSLDNVTGILYKTTALTELARGNQDVQLRDLARPALFVPRSKPADDLMKMFQQEQRHMAAVVNEFGGFMGLVTLEDLIEEVVGEIMDETDISEELIKRIGKNQILVHGRTEVRRINEFLKVDLGEEANTISGLIQGQLGRIPKSGEELRVENCRLLVREADHKSIKAVLIQKDEEKLASKGDGTEPSAHTDQSSLSRTA